VLLLVFLLLGKIRPEHFQGVIQFISLLLKFLILLRHVLLLFPGVTKSDNSIGDFLLQLVKVFISLLDFLIKSLVLYLELLEVDQVKPFSKLLLLFQLLILIRQLIPHGNRLDPILMKLRILCRLFLFPVCENLSRDLFRVPRELSRLSH